MNLSNITNQCGTFFDNGMVNVEDKMKRFETYCQSSEGQHRIKQIQLVSTFATTMILAMVYPVTVMVFTGIGIAVRSSSPETLDHIQQIFFRLVDSLPFNVKALVTVTAMNFTPIVFPMLSGLCMGFKTVSIFNFLWIRLQMSDLLSIDN